MRRGITVAVFQMAGILAWLYERLNRWVRKSMPVGPRCLIWWMVSPSGPTACEFPELRMFFATISGVKGEEEVFRG